VRKISFIPSMSFKDKVINMKVLAGEEIKFSDSNVYVDIDYIIENKIYDKRNFDVILECVAFKEGRDREIECILATLCKLVPETKNGKTEYKIKADSQKLKIKSYWYDMHDIYGFGSDLSG
jgi:hypothetical protein